MLSRFTFSVSFIFSFWVIERYSESVQRTANLCQVLARVLLQSAPELDSDDKTRQLPCPTYVFCILSYFRWHAPDSRRPCDPEQRWLFWLSVNMSARLGRYVFFVGVYWSRVSVHMNSTQKQGICKRRLKLPITVLISKVESPNMLSMAVMDFEDLTPTSNSTARASVFFSLVFSSLGPFCDYEVDI